MLPPIDTPERDALEQEAHDVAMRFLDEEHGSIPNALYRTYMHFKLKFRAGLSSEFSRELMEADLDARQLEALVADDWAAMIRERADDQALEAARLR